MTARLGQNLRAIPLARELDEVRRQRDALSRIVREQEQTIRELTARNACSTDPAVWGGQWRQTS